LVEDEIEVEVEQRELVEAAEFVHRRCGHLWSCKVASLLFAVATVVEFVHCRLGRSLWCNVASLLFAVAVMVAERGCYESAGGRPVHNHLQRAQ
jgi:hypothetical protein